MKGIAIDFEGIDGAGKSYTLEHLKKYYEELGKEVVVVPSISTSDFKNSFDPKWYDIYNSNNRYVQYLAYEVNNYYKNIKPQVEEGKIVLVDRYIPSCYAYNELPNDRFNTFMVDFMQLLCRRFFIPDVTFIFDVSNDVIVDRFERFRKHEDKPDLTFTDKVRERYNKFILEYSKPNGVWNVFKINGSRPIEEIVKEMVQIVEVITTDMEVQL